MIFFFQPEFIFSSVFLIILALFSKILSAVNKKYNKTKWQGFSFQEIRIVERGKRELHDWSALLPNGREIRPSVSYIPPEYLEIYNLKFFILDDEDVVYFEECVEEDKDAAIYIMNLEKFTRNRRKHFYVRVINTGNSNRLGAMSYSRKVFTDEVLEIIPLLMRQQSTPISGSDSRLEDYRNKWKSSDENLFTAIELDEFKKVLKDFDIDKSQITLVPDIIHYWSSIEIIERNKSYAVTLAPNGVQVMEPSHAAYATFFSLVGGVNWDSDALKSKIIHFQEIMKDSIIYYMNRKGEFMSVSGALDPIETARTVLLKTLPEVKIDNVDYKFSKFPTYTSPVPLKTYHSVCKSFGLPIYRDFTLHPSKNSVSIPAWMARFFVQAGWIQKLLSHPNMRVFKTYMIATMSMRKVNDPATMRNFLFFLRALLSSDSARDVKLSDSEIDSFIGKMEKSNEHNKVLESEKKREEILRQKKLDKKNKTGSDPSCSDVKTVPPEPSGKNKPSLTEQKIEPENNKSMKNKQTQTNPADCENCTKFNRVRDEVKKELEATKNKLKLSEGKAKQVDELEKVLSGIKNKIEKLESEAEKMKSLEKKASRVDELEKILEERREEMDKLKAEKARLTEENFEIRQMEGNAYEDMKLMEVNLRNQKAENKKLMESTKLITESRDQLAEKVKQLETQLIRNQKCAQAHPETVERERIIRELEEKSMRVSIQNQEQTKEIQNLLEKLKMGKQ